MLKNEILDVLMQSAEVVVIRIVVVLVVIGIVVEVLDIARGLHGGIIVVIGIIGVVALIGIVVEVLGVLRGLHGGIVVVIVEVVRVSEMVVVGGQASTFQRGRLDGIFSESSFVD